MKSSNLESSENEKKIHPIITWETEVLGSVDYFNSSLE
jgi:hypothetical protein